MNSHIENKISAEFLKLFENKTNLTINKIFELLEYFFKLIFNDIKEDLGNYNINFNDKKEEKKVKDALEKYFKNDENSNCIDKQKIIHKNNLVYALRWFMCLVLFEEKDKNKKIKKSKKNLINYLNAEDLWGSKIYGNTKFNQELSELKKLNIEINKIIWLYDYLVEDEEEDDDYIKEIEDFIENKDNKVNQNILEESQEININRSNSEDN